MAVTVFGGYSNVTQVVSAAADAQIQAEIAKLKALIGDPAARPSAPGVGPIFQSIDPPAAAQLLAEIDAMAAAIAAAPDA